MVSRKQVEKLLNRMGNDVSENLINIKEIFGGLDYKDDENQTLLHIFVDERYDQYKCYAAIHALLEQGLDPNAESDFGYNFIQTALYTGYSEEFILKIIKEALSKSLNPNHIDEDGDTMVHTAIYSDDYKGTITNIYKLLAQNGLDSTITDNCGRSLLDAMYSEKKFTVAQILEFKAAFNNEVENLKVSEKVYKETIKEKELPSVDKSKLETFGKILADKDYITSPTIGREQELKNLMITLALDTKNPIIVGESGVGKTALVEELAYRIKKGDVPKFLKNKIILEINPNELISGKRYVGDFEKEIKNLMKVCNDDRIILFIDEIHTIYGIGTHDKSDVDLAAMLKYYIDRKGIKIIGTTTKEEYEKYFSKDALKRRFECVDVKEPNNEILYQIIDKVMDDYINKTGINFKDENIKHEIIEIIIDATSKSHRVYNDILNNPDLSISIIERAFATAKVFDDEEITENNFIESFKSCNRLYDSTRDNAISKLEKINSNVIQFPSKIIRLDFKGRK